MRWWQKVREAVEDVRHAVETASVDDWPRGAMNDCLACGVRGTHDRPAHAPGEGCPSHEELKKVNAEYRAHVEKHGAIFPGDTPGHEPDGAPPSWFWGRFRR